MFHNPRMVVHAERLRDQVYSLILQDMQTGALEPGARLTEGALAERYNVSRTPVREALSQLCYSGILIWGARSYTISDSQESVTDCCEANALLDPGLARHAANDGTRAEIKALQRSYRRQDGAHRLNELDTFIRATIQFRTLLKSMCRNDALARCAQLLDDRALPHFRSIFSEPEARENEIRRNGRVLEMIASHASS